MVTRDYASNISELQKILGNNFLSFTTYGAGSFEQHLKQKTVENILIVVDKLDLETLSKLVRVVSGLIKQYNTEPLILTHDMMLSSSDVFPIEFLSIKDNYKVQWGKDLVAGLHVDLQNLRLQCELNLKGKLIVLQQAFLKGIKEETLLKDSFPLFMNTFANIIRLKHKDMPESATEVFDHLDKHFKVDSRVFRALYDQISRDKINHREITKTFGDYLNQLTILSKEIDQLKV